MSRKHGRIGDSFLTKDCGLGHESAGIVVQTGANVQHLNIGEYLSRLSPLLTCDRRPCCTGVWHPMLKAILRSLPHRRLQ